MRAKLLKPGSPLGNLEAFLGGLTKQHCRKDSKGCLLGTNMADFDTTDQAVAALLQHQLTLAEDIYYETLRNAIDAGEVVATTDPRATARMLVCLTQGVALVGRVTASRTTLKGTLDAALLLLKQSN